MTSYHMESARLSISHEAYRADRVCDVPTLSQSIAHTLVSRSPAHAWLQHPKLGNAPREATSAQDEGELIHRLLLGTGADIRIINADNFRTKLAQNERDEAIAAGEIPLLVSKADEVRRAAEAITSNMKALGIVLDGESEVPIMWSEQGEAGLVVCRGKIDHVKEDTLIDLKKIRNAHPRSCSAHAFEYGYDIQTAAYLSGYEEVCPHTAGRAQFLFVFFEIEPPYAVVPAFPSAQMRQVGQMRWQRAVNLWERCLSLNEWPAYVQSGTVELQVPPWAISEEVGNDPSL